MHSTTRAVAVAASLAALAVPAAALARPAKPVSNGNYCLNCTSKTAPGTFHVAKNGKAIDGFSYYNACSPLPIPNAPKIAIRKGKFAFAGTLVDVTKKKHKFTFKGTFTSSKVAVGVVNATGGGKTCKATHFKAKFTQTGPYQF